MSKEELYSRLDRQRQLIGDAATDKIAASSVLIFGVGGVGSYAAEAIARAGVGRITVCDHDVIAASNINRQLIADVTTVGQKKAEVMKRRIEAINPDCKVAAVTDFADGENLPAIIDTAAPNYIIDAIDTVSSKLALAVLAHEKNIPIICSMGTGNKLDPTRFRVSDISKTSVCPLARKMRTELKKRGIAHLDVLFSDEPPMKTGERTPASISFVPSAAGLIIAGHVIRKLAEV